jgi:ribosomal protein S18 acetylase RimI-like enzyme
MGPEPVGVAVCITGFSTFRARALTNVHDLAVVPGWRGRGIGRRLLAAVEDLARERGHCKITLEVREDNPAAMALYRRLGFGAGVSAGVAVQYVFLEKRLED